MCWLAILKCLAPRPDSDEQFQCERASGGIRSGMKDEENGRKGRLGTPEVVPRSFILAFRGRRCCGNSSTTAASFTLLFAREFEHLSEFPSRVSFRGHYFSMCVSKKKKMGFSPFGWLRRKPARACAEDIAGSPEERSPPCWETRRPAEEQKNEGTASKQDPRQKKEDESKRPRRSGAASGCASCFPKCLRFGKRRRGRGTEDGHRIEETDFVEEEAVDCLDASDASISTEADGEISPLPMSVETPLFQRFAFDENPGSLGGRGGAGKGEDVALVCYAKDDGSSSVEEVQRGDGDDENGYDEESGECSEEVVWFYQLEEDGVIIAGVWIRSREEQTVAMVVMQLEEGYTTWFEGGEEEDCEEERAMPKDMDSRACLTDWHDMANKEDQLRKGQENLLQVEDGYYGDTLPMLDYGEYPFFSSVLVEMPAAPLRELGAGTFESVLGENERPLSCCTTMVSLCFPGFISIEICVCMCTLHSHHYTYTTKVPGGRHVPACE